MEKNNEVVKAEARRKGVKLWAVAKHIGMGDTTLTRHLRFPLPDEEYNRIMAAIEELGARP